MTRKYPLPDSLAGKITQPVYDRWLARKTSAHLLPTVDHVGGGLGSPVFRICSWRTNDAKSDLSYEEFVGLCRRVVEYHDRVGASVRSERLPTSEMTTDQIMALLRGEDYHP